MWKQCARKLIIYLIIQSFGSCYIGQVPPRYFINYESGTCALPMTLTSHSPMNQPALRKIADVNGCQCRETPGVYIVCFGLDCTEFPTTVKITTPLFKIKESYIPVLKQDDLLSLINLQSLEIEANLKLSKIEPGCFRRMSSLSSLTISGNYALKQLEVNVFEGLVNLSLLDLRKNGFHRVIDATRALSVAYVPNLKRLELNENTFRNVNYNEFFPMNGSLLQELNLFSCGIEYIHPACLEPLKNIQVLRLGRNVFSEAILTRFMEKSAELGVTPDVLLNLYDAKLNKIPYEMMEALGKTNIMYLTLAYNHFDRIDDDSLPEMPRIIGLDLRGNLISSISPHAFARQPRLIALLLACNELTEVPPGALVPTLVEVDFAMNSVDSETPSFSINDYVFANMTRLTILQLSFNNIAYISKNMFWGLNNLGTLNIKACSLYYIEPGSFEPLKNLLVLNLSSNALLGASLFSDSFKGLESLQVLHLDECGLTNLTWKQSLFLYTPNLTYLSLTKNDLFTITPNQFDNLEQLKMIDLSDNKLTWWSENLFARTDLSVLNLSKNKITLVTSQMLMDWSTVDYLLLDDNYLSCDCTLNTMSSWVQQNKSATKYMQMNHLSGLCIGPGDWLNKPIWNCLQEANQTFRNCQYKEQTLIITLTAVFFILVTLFVMRYMFRWYFGYWMFLLRMKQQQRQFESNRTNHRDDNTYKYDAFVSYCNDDREFVMQLVSMMENFEPYLKLCIYERDFQIGTNISEAILQSVTMSKRTLLIISDAFAKSHWCRWETQLAEYHQLFFQNESPDDADDTLLMVKLTDVSRFNMTPTLKYLMKTRIYLEWDKDSRKQRIFWSWLNVEMNLLFLLFIIHASCEPNTLIEHRFPMPKFRDTYLDIEVELLTTIEGCMFRQTLRKAISCMGTSCKVYPAEIKLNTTVMKIRKTSISVLRKNDFRNLKNVSLLSIEFNPKLETIEPSCFRNMSLVTNMTISFNQNLKVLEENVFEGLINLKEIHLNKNGFSSVLSATQALTTKYLPVLELLSMNENIFMNVFRDDFKPLAGSKLSELQIILCQIDYIHPQSLNPLIKLERLKIGQNQFNVSVITNLINEMNRNKIQLNALSIYNAGFRRRTPMLLLQAVAESSIIYLNIAQNSFDNLDETSFPFMPNLKILDLSSCLLLNIAPGTFKNIPQLESLFLADNILPNIPDAVLLPQLKDLDFSGNSGNAISRSYLRIADKTFENMTQLRSLKLSNNLISTVYSLTFYGLVNLEYFVLKNASIFDIRVGSFLTLRKLKYLNIENNHMVYTFSSKVFEGLNNLDVLLMGGCSHHDLSMVPSMFYHLQNLTFLGLENNEIDSIPSTAFAPLKNLVTLTLAQNSLTEWTNRLFVNLSLKEFDLSQNKIKSLTIPMLEDMEDLDQINIEDNPFSCDCSLYTIAKWLRTHNMTAKYIQHDEFYPKCMQPDTVQQVTIIEYIQYLKTHDVCDDSPVMNESVIISLVSVLIGIILILTVLGYVYRTHIRHWMLLVRMAFRRYFFHTEIESSPIVKYKYDAFVSYSNEDQDFVVNLVTMLENYEPYLKLCVYERDFQIGTGISESVLKSVASSRKTLLIISDAFAKSQWCRWEAKLAEHHHLFFQDANLKGSSGTLLMILLNPVSKENLTPTLRYLLKTRIYLEWCDNENMQKIFWEKLRKKLSASPEQAFESQISIKEE